ERVRGRRPLTRQHYLQNGAIILNPIIQNADELPIFTESIQSNDAKHVLVEIPANYQTIKQQDLQLAQQWRLHTRQVFDLMFQNGYTVTDFVSDMADGYRRSFYRLTC
ncbi:MAG: hypothetical protein GY943_08310, partial [Chloroflexi bacterium]|nr:hypothetical protein [Chloroflexota bacterium]